MAYKINLTADELRKLVHYDPETGVFTRYPRTGTSRADSIFNTRWAGVAQGAKSDNGYVKIGVNGKHMFAHRLAWLYMTGELPDLIDHKNGDKTDNRFCNLRLADKPKNAFNQKTRVDNSLGVKGVYVCKKTGRFVVEIKANKTKHFIGRYSTLEEAKAARDAAAERLHGTFARAA